jgi:hypothetical protein
VETRKMIKMMEDNNDYKLVFYTLHEILDNSYYNGVNSFAPDKNTCSEYSLSRPAIQFSTNEETNFLRYVIEINRNITKEIIQSWIKHSQGCNHLFIIVPEEIKTNVESILVREISNYSVIPFRIEMKGKINRTVKIDI